MTQYHCSATNLFIRYAHYARRYAPLFIRYAHYARRYAPLFIRYAHCGGSAPEPPLYEVI